MQSSGAAANTHTHPQLTVLNVQPCPWQPADDFVAQPHLEVKYWVTKLVEWQGDGQDMTGWWRRIPLYSQYISRTPLHQVLQDMVAGLRSCRATRLRCEDAAELPVNLACTTVLPVAVAAEYAAAACAMPAAFVADMFCACLASCLHPTCCVAPYWRRAPNFITRGKFWATPTGDPNAGKSPVYQAMYVAFKEVIVANAQCFPFESRAEFHVYMGGNHGGFNECMRATDGVCLYIGPEAKVMLDPKFPWSGIANVVQFVDMPRLLECASGGAYVWDTATEAKAARLRAAQAAEAKTRAKKKRPDDAGDVEDPLKGKPLSFLRTSVNLCMFQQYRVFRKWWVQVEANEGLGFSARILTSFSKRAVFSREWGRRSEEPVKQLCKHIWQSAAQAHGHGRAAEMQPFVFSEEGEACFQESYHEIADVESEGGWPSALKSVLGKFEYWGPCVAQLTELEARACSHTLDPGTTMSAEALKCAIRFFDARLALGCSVVDSEVAAAAASSAGAGRQLPAVAVPVQAPPGQAQLQETASPTSGVAPKTVLLRCADDPISYGTLQHHFGYLKRDVSGEERYTILTQLRDAGFGWLATVKSGRKGKITTPRVQFFRFGLDEQMRAKLQDAGIPANAFRPSQPAIFASQPLPANAFVGGAEDAIADCQAPTQNAGSEVPRMLGAGSRWVPGPDPSMHEALLSACDAGTELPALGCDSGGRLPLLPLPSKAARAMNRRRAAYRKNAARALGFAALCFADASAWCSPFTCQHAVSPARAGCFTPGCSSPTLGGAAGGSSTGSALLGRHVVTGQLPRMLGAGADDDQSHCADASVSASAAPEEMEELIEAGRPFGFPADRSSAAADGYKRRIADSCPDLQEALCEAGGRCLHWYFLSDYIWFTTMLRGDQQGFAALCKARLRIDAHADPNPDQLCAVERYANVFRRTAARWLAAIYAALPLSQQRTVAFRGMRFANKANLTTYLSSMESSGGDMFQSCSLFQERSLAFANGAVAPPAALSLAAKRGYMTGPKDIGLMVIFAGLSFVDVSSWNVHNTGEQEVWIRDASAKCALCSADHREVSRHLSSQLGRTGVSLPTADVQAIVKGVKQGGGSFFVAVFTPAAPAPDATAASHPTATDGGARRGAKRRRGKSPGASWPPRATRTRSLAVTGGNCADSSGGQKTSSVNPGSGAAPANASQVTEPVLSLTTPASSSQAAALETPTARQSRTPGTRGFSGFLTGAGALAAKETVEHKWSDVVYNTHTEFKTALQTWAWNLHTKNKMKLLFQQRDAPIQKLKYRIWCGSCKKCVKAGQGWYAWAVHSQKKGKTLIKATPVSAHGAFDRMVCAKRAPRNAAGKADAKAKAKAGSKAKTKANGQSGRLTQGAKFKLQEAINAKSVRNIQDALRTVRRLQAAPVSEQFLADFLKNTKRDGDAPYPKQLGAIVIGNACAEISASSTTPSGKVVASCAWWIT